MSEDGARCTHLGLDLLFLLPGHSGGRETYVRELLAALRQQRPELRITAFVNRETAAAGSELWTSTADHVAALRASPTSRTRWAPGQMLWLPRAARKAGVDVLHSPANVAPLHAAMPRVVTVHDMLFERPSTRMLVRRAASSAAAVITVSQAARQAIAGPLGLAADRIAVIANGAAPPRALASDPMSLRARHRLGTGPMALVVAADLPHKNLDGALRGLAAMEAAARPVLVFVGSGTDAERLRGRAREFGVEEHARMLGRISEDELEQLYQLAALVVSPSLSEGFGLVALDALARGVPIACSDIPVAREVVGDCGVFFDANNAAEIAAAMAQLARGGTEVRERAQRGLRRAQRFTWQRTAERTLAVYDGALAA